MVLLFDTNIVLYYLLVRESHYEYAEQLINFSQERRLKTYVAFHSMSIIWYHLRKKFSSEECRKFLLKVTNIFTVTGASHNEIVRAILNEDFPDFEDCLQEKCALAVGADYIITNNVKDFSASEIPAVTPSELLEIVHSS